MGLGSLFKGKAKKLPQPTDIFSLTGGQIKGVSDYYNQALPAFLGMEEKYSPQFIDQAFGFGERTLGSLTDLQRAGGMEAAQSIGDLRAQELGIMGQQAPLMRGLMESLSPEQAAAVRASAQEAERATASSMGVTPQEQRMYQQTAREAAQASGRLGGNAAIAEEIMGRENVLASKRAEAAQARQNSYNLAGNFYTDRGLPILGSTPASYSTGAANAQSALGLGQELGADLDYNLPLNLARERAGAVDARNMAQYQADMQAKASRNKMIGNLIGMAAVPFTGGLSAGLGLTGLAGGAAGMTGLSGLGVSAGMGLGNMLGMGIPKAKAIY